MRRRLFAAVLLSLVSCGQSADRTNILFITLDDMNWDSVGAFGAKVPDTTPNIDQLASEGMRFEQAHVTISSCQPIRAVWMTGRYPQNSGALAFDPIREDVPTLPERLRAAGYLTGIMGKTDHVIPSRKGAFEYRRERSEMNNGRSAERYGAFSEEFFRAAVRSEQPFFLMVNTHDPHRPFDNRKPARERSVETETTSPRETRTKGKKERGDSDPAPSRIFEADEIVVPGFLPDLPEVREEMAQYYSSVRRADDVVGAVLESLAAAGLSQNTIVIFSSDHGMSFPFAKMNLWRNSTRTPWIVRWPGVVEPGSHDTEHLLAGVDFAPSILDALGIDPMEGMDGRSFVPLLTGRSQAGREYVYTQVNTTSSGRSYPMRSVQTSRFGFIWNAWSDSRTKFEIESQAGRTWRAMTAAAESNPDIAGRVEFYAYRVPMEFYDYQLDPDALRNLIDDPASQEQIQILSAKLLEYMQATNDPQLAAFRETMRIE